MSLSIKELSQETGKKKHIVKEGIRELTGHAGRFLQGWLLPASPFFVSTNNYCVPDLFKPHNIFGR